MGIATKLGLLQGAFAVVVVSLGLLLAALADRPRLREQIHDKQAAEVGMFGHVCANALDAADQAPCVTYLRTLILMAEGGTIAYAAFLDDKGRVVIHSDFLHGDESAKGARLESAEIRRAVEAPKGLRQASAVARGPADLLSAPVYRAGPSGAPQRAGTVLVAFDDAAVDRMLVRLRRDWLWRWAEAALPGIGLGLVLSVLLAGALSRPIQTLREGARRIGQGKLDARIPDARSDELGDLAREFNAMAAKLAELDELKEGFLAQITHDLRNPLAAIASYADVLLMGLQGPVNEKQTKALKIISSSTMHLNELIGNILDITKLEAGKMDLKPGDVDFSALAVSVAELMQAKADEYGVTLDVSGIPDGSRVWADEAALRRVLVNLMSNALKFTPKDGCVRIKLSTIDGVDRVSVSDTGIGIPAEKLNTLFQKFSQIAETKNKVRAVHGTGLGLVICKQLVEAHGGRIGVDSVYQKGTTFHFSLPKRA